MDALQFELQPNLKFVSELKSDLKEKYLEQYGITKNYLSSFLSSLQKLYQEHQKILTDNLELRIINEKLRKRIEENEACNEIEILEKLHESSLEDNYRAPDYKKLFSTEIQSSNEKVNGNNNDKYNEQIIRDQSIEKIYEDAELMNEENNFDVMDICSTDFNSDIEENVKNDDVTPPVSKTNTPVKIKNSPIFSKKKKTGSKKNSSFVSNSSWDSKISFSESISDAFFDDLDANVNQLLHNMNQNNSTENEQSLLTEISSELKDETNKEVRKVVNNRSVSSTSYIENEKNKNLVLGISKISCGKSDYTNDGKKLKQATLGFLSKNNFPLTDVTKHAVENICEKTSMIFDREANSASSSLNYQQIQALGSKLIQEIEKHQSKVLDKEDDLIKASPTVNTKSKLRNKLFQLTKSDSQKISSRLNEQSKKDLMTERPILKSISLNKIIVSSTSGLNNNKRKGSFHLLENQNSILSKSKFEEKYSVQNKSDHEVEIVDLEKEIKCNAPPSKKILLNNFDVVSNEVEESLSYAYIEPPVRKKADRDKLLGWCCLQCANYYEKLDLTEEEKEQRKNECSRHRGKFKPHINTPESFWDVNFKEANTSSCDN
ncbi:hypothetical protein TKK_0013275 [Trichogramma kaykai]|uniref:DNA endonuclease activator Ctp1 C-terminal domain-containing protein n=1 Tax=Trichogramma kaykai TaxID=54128 RepID=A0ABD2WIG6_9HYME